MVLLKSLATPVVWVLVLMTVGLILTRWARGRKLFRVGWWSLLIGAVVLTVCSLEPVANGLLYSLEHRYASATPEVLATLDVIVVLGGGLYPSGTLREEPDLAREAYPRLYHGVRYFKDSGADVIAFCGGPPKPGAESEAVVMQAMAVSLGVPEDRTVREPKSRNTMGNAANLAKILPAGEGRRIGIVTSATHMMRSKWVFERVFPRDTIVPMPVYFTYDPPDRIAEKIAPSVSYLERTTVALHEWIGILWYAVRY